MNFNTPLFLFLFLPFFLIVYFFAQPRWRPAVGVLASLIFYSWGQAAYIPLMIAVILFNYWLGLRLGRNKTKSLFYIGLAANLGLLIFLKLLTTYGLAIFFGLAPHLPQSLNAWLLSLAFPLGLSYISFQVISYLIDVQKGIVQPEKKFISFAFYVLLFPKILVGPIVRYRTLADQLTAPSISSPQIAAGIRRFILGFAKKLLIADVLAKVVNAVFGLPISHATPGLAWLALISYALQIYFDFSGYTDMALGLASMMGLNFIENFNYPYISQSVGDFWRRWHISLSTWFRDYVFYPLERRRIRFVGQPLNILIVFLLTGLWHGVTPTFVIWGLLHGIFLALESLFLGRWLRGTLQPLRHLYALAAILFTWLIFRAPDLPYALAFMRRLAGDASGYVPLSFTQTAPLPFLEPSFWLAFGFGILFSLPIFPLLEKFMERIAGKSPAIRLPLTAIGDLFLLALFILSVGMMTASKFLPGIYGSF